MFHFKRFFASKEKKEITPKLNLLPLDAYIKKKGGGKVFDLKNFSTPLNLGKYELALLLRDKLARQTDAQTQCRILFIGFKLNEFLEKPSSYAHLEQPLQSLLTNRRDFYQMINESQVYGIQRSAELEVARLFDLLHKMYKNYDCPNDLPESLATGSGWGSSSLHLVLKDLYQNCKNIERSPAISP